MEKINIFDSGQFDLKESFYDILKEISEIKPQTTFTKEQEEEFLKDAIAVFEYLKSGIDIRPSEILINNREVSFSCLEKILTNFSKKITNDDNKDYTFYIYRSNKGEPVKIYELQKNEKKCITGITNTSSDRPLISRKGRIFYINSCSSKIRDSLSRLKLKKIIKFALKNEILIIYDVTSNLESKDTGKIKSIYEIENAKNVAIEFKRFSSVDNVKITCGYLVVPKCLKFNKEDYKEYNFEEFKERLQEEMQKVKVS